MDTTSFVNFVENLDDEFKTRFTVFETCDNMLLYLVKNPFVVEARGVLSGKVGTGMCGPDRVLFRPLRFTNGPFFLFENWFKYRLRFCKIHNFQ